MKTKKNLAQHLVAGLMAWCLCASAFGLPGPSIVLAEEDEVQQTTDASTLDGAGTTEESESADKAPKTVTDAKDEQTDTPANVTTDEPSGAPEASEAAGDSDTTSVDGLWDIEEIPTGVAIVSYHGSDTEVTVPATVTVENGTTYTITILGQKVFKDNTTITSVTLPDSLVYMMPNAFQGCSSLTSVTFGSNSALTAIPSGCFSGCRSLPSIAIPSSVKSVDGYAFQDCTALSSVDFSNATNLTSLGHKAFMGCTSLAKANFPASLATLGTEAFRNCTSLASVSYIGEALTIIPESCFTGCTSLTRFMVPACVKSVGDHAFQDCTGLKQVGFNTVPVITSIGEDAFRSCTALTTVSSIPKTVTTIGANAFADCTSLATVTFAYPEESHLDNLGTRAFANCSSLKEILVPFCGDNWSSKMGDYAFAGCTSLESVGFWKFPNLAVNTPHAFDGCTKLKFCWWRFDGTDPLLFIHEQYGLPEFCTFMGFELSKNNAGDESLTIYQIKTKTPDNSAGSGSVDLVIPASFATYDIKQIAAHAAHKNYELGSVSFAPDSMVSVIGEEAFIHCESMKSASLPASLKTLGKSAFKTCASLESVTFVDNSIEVLPQEAFANCMSLPKIKLPEGLLTVSKDAFSYCVNLTEVYFPDTLEEIDDDAFDSFCSKVALVRMPDSDQLITMGANKFYHNLNVNNLHFLVTAGSWSEDHLTRGGDYLAGRLWYVPVDLSDSTVNLGLPKDYTATYNGEEQYSILTGKRWFHTMTVDEDYTIDLSQSNCRDAGRATVVFVAKDYGEHLTKFKGSRTVEFDIERADITDVVTAVFDTPEGGCFYDDKKWEPEFTLTYPNLSSGKDYTLTEDDYILPTNAYQNNVQAGTATLTVDGINNFKGSRTFEFPIRQRDLSSEGKVDGSYEYQDFAGGKPVCPDPLPVYVLDRNKEAIPLTDEDPFHDFDVSYENNTEPSVYSTNPSYVVYTGASNNIVGTLKVPFFITPKSIEDADVTVGNIPDKMYSGSLIRPDIEIKLGDYRLQKDKDFSVTYENNFDVGEATAIVKGTFPRFRGRLDLTFNIVPRKITITADDKVKAYGEKDPELTATQSSSHYVVYTLERKRGEAVGTYAITVKPAEGQSNYDITTVDGTLTIKPGNLSEATVVAPPDVTYDGLAWEPDPEVTWHDTKLVAGKDYTLSYENNLHAGTATVTIQGTGNFAGKLTTNFTIKQFDISGTDCEAAAGFQVHTGTPLKPIPRVTIPQRGEARYLLENEQDFEIKGYSDNVDTGTGTVTIVGTNSCTGELEIPFNIVDNGDLSQGSIDEIPEQTYTGGFLEPELKVYLKGMDLWLTRDVDYVAKFTDNKNAGEATVTVTGNGPLSGSLTATFTISPANIAKTNIAVSDCIYDGTAQEPEPTVTWNEMLLLGDTDYVVLGYQNNVNVGSATITVVGKGNFVDNKTDQFEIKERPITAAVEDMELEYTGSMQYGSSVVTFTGTAPNQTANITYAPAQGTLPGTYQNGAFSQFEVTDEGGADVTKNYTLTTLDGSLTVKPANLGNTKRFTVAPIADETYNGKQHKPVPTITDQVAGKELVEGTDFTLTYKNNVKAGTATITVKGIGYYTGSLNVTFKIAEAPILYKLVSAPKGSIPADGTTKPEFKFTRIDDDAATFSHFTGIEVDGKRVGKDSYTARKGSVVVTLNPSYVKTLSAGNHTITALFDDGSCDASFKVASSKVDPNPQPKNPQSNNKSLPKTGDPSIPPVVIGGLVGAGILLVVMGLRRRRK